MKEQVEAGESLSKVRKIEEVDLLPDELEALEKAESGKAEYVPLEEFLKRLELQSL
ncbi:MAG: hypothetical protein GXO07_02245 [Crenarchaeota archaeon]|nr:hypothetical protein [Thermoproteota archaeon]